MTGLSVAALALLVVAACTESSVKPPLTAPRGPNLGVTDPFNDQGNCLGEDYAAGGGGGSITETQGCTANDISVARTELLEYSFDGSQFFPFTGAPVECDAGDPVFLRLRAFLVQTAASSRTDIGVWIATDGGTARTKVASPPVGLVSGCNQYNLAPAPPFTDPFTSVDGVTNVDNDQCGDMLPTAATGDSAKLELGVIGALCQGLTPTSTTVHVGSCLSWTVPGGDQTCPTAAGPAGFRLGTLPSSTPKCNCDGFDVPINIRQTAKIEIKKTCNPTGDAGTFDFKIDGSFTDTDGTFGDNVACGGTTGQRTVGAGTTSSPGADHTVVEDGFSIAASNYTSTVSCTKNGQAYIASGAYTTPNNVNVHTDPSDVVVCTFVNTRKGAITIVKDAVPNGPTDFSFTTTGTGLSSFDLDDDGDNANTLSNTKSFTGLTPGAYSVTEAAAAGFDLTALTCSDANSTGSTGTRTASINVEAGETVTCTFTNTQQGSITIIKDAVPNDPQDFAYTTSGTGLSSFSLDDDGDNANTLSNTKVFNGLSAGPYSVTETLPVTGWDLTNLQCNASGAGTSATPTLATGLASITLAAGGSVTCTYTNTKRGSITIIKDTQNPATDPEDFSFTTTGTGLSSFDLDDDGDNANTLSNTKTFTNLVPGPFSVTEGAETNWTLTALTCSDANSTGNTTTRVASINVEAGESVTCTFVNQRKARLRVQKLFSPANLSFDFTRNPGGVSFSLTNLQINDSGFLLAPGTYRVCELNNAVTFSATATLDGGAATLINPDLPQDLGNRCVDVTLAYGGDRIVVFTNNPPPGGDARTIGYWKNWSSCTGGNQIAVATRKGLLDKTLDFYLPSNPAVFPIGDITSLTCLQAVALLDKSDISTGKKMASDPAYNLAAQFFAAKLNYAAGAKQCPLATTAIAQAQALLDAINFTGIGAYKASMSAAQQTLANSLATTLDSYNNNTLACP